MGGIGVEGAELVRVLAIAQVSLLLDDHRQAGGKDGPRGGIEVARDLRVVGRRQRERLARELLARLGAHRAQCLDVTKDRCVLRRAGDRRHAREVLRRGTQERHAADVDLLERLVEARRRLPDRLREGVEIHDDEVDLLDVLLGELREVVRIVAAREEPGEDLRVERLHPPTEDLVRLGQLADGPDLLEALVGQVRARAIGREDLGAGIGQAAGKLDDAFTVTDGEQGAQSTSPSVRMGRWCVGPPIIGARTCPSDTGRSRRTLAVGFSALNSGEGRSMRTGPQPLVPRRSVDAGDLELRFVRSTGVYGLCEAEIGLEGHQVVTARDPFVPTRRIGKSSPPVAMKLFTITRYVSVGIDRDVVQLHRG